MNSGEGYDRAALRRLVNDHRREERHALGHEVRLLHGELPFEAEISLSPLLRPLGDDGQEERALRYLAPDLLVPGIPTAQLALVEPNLNAVAPERVGDATSDVRVRARN